jgi:hypothetical protein
LCVISQEVLSEGLTVDFVLSAKRYCLRV